MKFSIDASYQVSVSLAKRGLDYKTTTTKNFFDIKQVHLIKTVI
jgi:hypothetical protein